MNEPLFTRLLWSLVIIAGAYLLIRLALWWILNRARNTAQHSSAIEPGRPTVIYFTTPDCVPCRTIQRPALQKALSQLGETFQLIEVNAYEKPELARQWGVLSIPTTFVLDSTGKPRHVNFGVAPAEKLIQQLKDLL